MKYDYNDRLGTKRFSVRMWGKENFYAFDEKTQSAVSKCYPTYVRALVVADELNMQHEPELSTDDSERTNIMSPKCDNCAESYAQHHAILYNIKVDICSAVCLAELASIWAPYTYKENTVWSLKRGIRLVKAVLSGLWNNGFFETGDRITYTLLRKAQDVSGFQALNYEASWISGRN